MPVTLPHGLTLDEVTDPVKFQQVVLQRTLWGKQRQMVRSAARNRKTSVKGCHASGKTMAASGMPLHWLLQDPAAKAFQVSPTLRQVKIFWNEVGIARDNSLIKLPEVSTTGIRISRDRFAFGASASKGVNLQALHGTLLLILVDEAMGVEADIWYALDGIAAGGIVHLVMMGNPTVPGGRFYDSFRDPTCEKITISAFDTPNLLQFRAQLEADGVTREDMPEAIAQLLVKIGKTNPGLLDKAVIIPGLINPRWVMEKYLTWGPKHPAYQGRVLAIFPTQGAYSVFSLDWIERAARDPYPKEQHVLDEADPINVQLGIDVAAGGDAETVLCARCNGHILGLWATQLADPDEQFGFLRERIIELKRMPRVRITGAVVDVNGPGYHLAPRVAELGVRVFAYMAGARAIDREQFRNSKAEEYWRFRYFMQQNWVSGLDDKEAQAQLATVQFKETGTGILIESKDEAAKRGIKSPDRGEAIILAFANMIERDQETDEDMLEGYDL